MAAVAPYSLRPKEMEALFVGLGWRDLVALGPNYRQRRLLLLAWACGILDGLPPGPPKDRLRQTGAAAASGLRHGFQPALAAR